MSVTSLFRVIGSSVATVRPQLSPHTRLISRLMCTEPALQTSKKVDVTPIQTVSPEDTDKLYKSLEIELKGCDPAVLKSYTTFATSAAEHLGIELGKCWAQRKAQHDRMTLLKSVHIYKKHRVQYEIRTYFRFMQFHKLTGSTLDTFLEYIERNLPEGVALKAAKVELEALPPHIQELV